MQKFIKKIKKSFILIFILSVGLVLSACSTSPNVPLGDLSEDNVYVSFEDLSISELELYNSLRFQASDILASMIDEIVFEAEILEVKALISEGDEYFNDFIDENVNQAIYGITDVEALEERFANNEDKRNREILKFVDTIYLVNPEINREDLFSEISNLQVSFKGYSQIEELLDEYILKAAQRHYARKILLTNVGLEDTTEFISDEDILSYYKSNREGRHNVNALIIRFLNLNEANAALFAVGLKSDSRGNWYQVPDIRIDDENDPGYVDLTDLSSEGYAHVVEILEDLNLLDKVQADRNLLSAQEYERYYTSYSISTTRSTGLSDVALPDTLVKDKFVDIYNLLNPSSQIYVNTEGNIVGLDSEYSSLYSYEDLTDISTSLRAHLFNTLTSETKQDLEDASNPYSARVQTYGNSRYLVYKLNDNEDDYADVLISDPEDEDSELFNPESEIAQEISNEIREEIISNKLTTTYVTEKVEELYENTSVDIFDPIIRTFFNQTFAYTGTNSNRSGSVVARVDEVDIEVNSLYDELEKRFGVTVSIDLLTNKFLLDNTDYSISDEDLETYNTQFEEIIRQFSSNSFASNGFPASIGRETFLLLAFGSLTNEEAVYELYVYPELRNQYSEDYTAHYGEEVFQLFTDLAKIQHDEFKSTQVSHLLVYFDNDGDGFPDNPQEYFDTISEASVNEIKLGLKELVEDIYEKIGQFKSDTEALNALSDLFNSSGRIERGSNIVPYDLQIELEYSKYRRLGFNLKFENIPSTITNSSNFLTNSSTLDKVFYDRAIALHDLIVGDEGQNSMELPYLDFYDDYIFNGLDLMNVLDSVQSTFGWHFIMTNVINEAPSAVYSSSEDLANRYQLEDGLNVYNESPDDLDNPGSKHLSLNQVEYYLRQSQTDEGATLPTAVQKAITTYLSPVMTRYESTFMQRELLFKIFAEKINFFNEDNHLRFDITRLINTNQLNDYLLNPSGYFDSNYSNLYGNWIEILENQL